MDSCKLGRLDEARRGLAIAFEMPESDDEYGPFYRNLAREDKDLQQLWPEISDIARFGTRLP